MDFDIDSFLDKFEKEIKENNSRTFDLEFQKEVEDVLSDVEKNVVKDDFQLLNSVYSTIKNFSQDLPFKFLDISEKSSEVLDRLGKYYSEGYFKVVLNNAEVIEKEIISILESLEVDLKNQCFSAVFKGLFRINSLLKEFPKGFYEKKVNLVKKVRIFENKFYHNAKLFSEELMIRFSREIPYIVSAIKEAIKRRDLNDAEKFFKDLKILLKSIPLFLESNFYEFKVRVNLFLNFVEKIICDLRREIFENQLFVINRLISHLHVELINKNVEKSIFLYYEIVNKFHKLDERFIGEKIELYEKIVDLFSDLNKLVLKHNIELFLNSFEESKKEEIREKLKNHIKKVGCSSVNEDTMNLVGIDQSLKEVVSNCRIRNSNSLNKIKDAVVNYNQKKKGSQDMRKISKEILKKKNVAEVCGFNSSKEFREAFQKVFGSDSLITKEFLGLVKQIREANSSRDLLVYVRLLKNFCKVFELKDFSLRRRFAKYLNCLIRYKFKEFGMVVESGKEFISPDFSKVRV